MKKCFSYLLILALLITSVSIPDTTVVKAKETKEYMSEAELKVYLANEKMKIAQEDISRLTEDDEEWYDKITVNTETGKVKKDGETTSLKNEFDISKKESDSLKKDKKELKEFIRDDTACDVTSKGDTVTITNDYQWKRLIVKTEHELKDTYGAIDKAVGIRGKIYLQYETPEDCQKAEEKLNQLDGVIAVPDRQVEYTIDDVDESAEIEDIPTLDDTKSNLYRPYSWETGEPIYYFSNNLMGLDGIYETYYQYKAQLNETVVAVIDTGCDMSHPLLQGRLLPSYENTNDTDSHGTHVCGIIAAATPSNVKILPINIIGDDQTKITEVEAFDYSIEAGASVINMSYGGYWNEDFNNFYNEDEAKKNLPSDDYDYIPSNEVLSRFLESHYYYYYKEAYEAGIVLVAAAGNGNLNAGHQTPCNLPYTVCVSAIQKDKTITSFSNWGKVVDYCAPGQWINSTIPTALDTEDGKQDGLTIKSGTSMAAPHVSATFAYLKSAFPDKNKDELMDLLNGYCEDLGEPGKDIYYGNGLPNKLSLLFSENALGINEEVIDPETCPHTEKVKITTVEPDCLHSGYNAYMCKRCKKTIYDPLSPLGHSNDLVSTTDATCTVDGHNDYVCSRCGEKSSVPINKLDHKWTLTDAVDPTCTEDGYENYKCRRCSETKTETLDKLDHNWLASSDTKAATCTEDGYKKYNCSRCSETRTDILEKLGHDMNYSSDNSYEPTCTSEGNEAYYCSRCDHVENHPIEALGHLESVNVTTPTCSKEGTAITTCTRCNAILNIETIPMKEHTYTLINSMQPTSIDFGWNLYKCSECGEYHYDYIQPHLSDSNTNTNHQQVNNNKGQQNIQSNTSTLDIQKKPSKKVSVTKAKNIKTRKVSLAWKTVKYAKNYEIQYALNKTFTKSKKTIRTNKLKYTIKGLKKNKTYYIRIRGYVKTGNITYYGGFSSVKKIKIKK